MKKVKGQPITGSSIAVSSKKPFVPNAKDTSANAQTMIAEDPTPFKNRNQLGSMPAPSGDSGGVSAAQSGMRHSSPGARALPQRGPIGQRKPINQSGQMNGRMGTSFPKRKGAFPSGFGVKRNANFYGE